MNHGDTETRRKHRAWALCLCVSVVQFLVLLGCSKSPESASSARPVFTAKALCIGQSMLPEFSEQEWVNLELCPFSALRTGDTIIYWNNEVRLFVHHRLIQRDATDGLWLARGDNNAGRDVGRVTADEFVGRTHKFP